MQIELNVDAISSLLAFVQALLLGFFFLTYKGGNRKANIFLGVFVLSYYFGDFYNFVGAAGVLNHSPNLAFFPSLALFWLGPSIYFYVKAIVEETFQLNRKILLFYLPGILEVIAGLAVFFQSLETKVAFSQSETFYAVHHIYSLLAGIHAVFFVYLSLRLYYQYKSVQADESPGMIGRQARWLKYFLYYWLVSFIIWVIIKVVIIFFAGILDYDLNFFSYITTVLNITSLIVVYALSYFTLKHLNVVSSFFQKRKYANSRLDLEKEKDFYQKAKEIMETDKSYLNPDLKVADLAANLAINSKYLSQIINKQFNGSFIDFVNAYRIEEVKQKLNDPAKNHLTISAIAEECGFKSKSTFTRVFRSQTGMLPKQYKEQKQVI